MLTIAELDWNDDNHPYSTQFNDHYYSQVDGLDEVQHVFIQGNQLATRWTALAEGGTFTIMETGFGSGLNFLATWEMWRIMKLGGSRNLHFISVEKYPMSREQLQRSLSNWNDKLSVVSKKLMDNYPPLKETTHNLLFKEDNIKLTLIFSDISELFPILTLPENTLIDAWFLDGFAPSKNPQMWQPELYHYMHRLSRNGASVATYTVAGLVRRGLIDAGFEIQYKPGFGTKRDMLTAVKN
ncbi:MAG: tRNA (5-methylaminomethyl-2-thiouridine)(34)-methyltransferase MnmD [Gammaproteobacteria bacterium]|nr:tRNA (5-methylaminomethyl-2-thiouridine)(34)-methyltransferase MnmD [Gammaproteobacteria bacterium]